MARKRTAVLSKKEVDTSLKELSDWKATPKCTQIYKTFEFPDFVAALAFVAKVTVYAEVFGHHPDIELSYGKVKVKLTTHEVKGLTQKDFHLAGLIENIRRS